MAQNDTFPTERADECLAFSQKEKEDIDTFNREIQPKTTYLYDYDFDTWHPHKNNDPRDTASLEKITISSYNVLYDPEHPAPERYPLLLQNILSPSALSDVLVLQEVSDDFLCHLLQEPRLKRSYPYVTHGPPQHSGVDSLPSLRNVVILSKLPFTWTLVPFHRRYKAAVVAKFQMANKMEPSKSCYLIVAGIHLTCGLTDGAVAAKKIQLQNVKSYLEQHHPDSPWIIAGDFNITTSATTIANALKKNSISQQTAGTMKSMEAMLTETGLLDAWSVARLEGADDTNSNDDALLEEAGGATFNPRANSLAAATSGSQHNQPQRYDRILVRPQGVLCVTRFNDFGHPRIVDDEQQVASDHWGIRATMKVISHTEEAYPSDTYHNPLQVQHLAPALADTHRLRSALVAHDMVPTSEDVKNRADAFSLIKKVLLGSSNVENTSMADVPLVIVPVGSYALGTWTSSSDIDCLCIGSISSKTFFQLARQRIRRAEARGVRLVRKVDAATGTMFELSVNDINVDLQYCPAARIVEGWSELPTLHHTDPIFNLSMLSLRKLKPYRDITYLQRSLPSLSAFRLAFRAIKLWAIQCGLYSSKFGYLSGIQITLMLSLICKRLTHDARMASPAEIVATFFYHYANFDWKNDIVFDPFFHKKQPRYHRTAREPMAVLGFHAPHSNAAYTSTVPGLNTLVKEFDLAYRRLSDDEMTWDRFFSTTSGAETNATEFLQSHDSYAQVNIQYWGRSLSKGKSLVGWVESRCLLLVVDINKALPDLGVRIWPARFTNQDTSSDLSSEYEGCYLIGLSKPTNSGTSTAKEEKAIRKRTLDKVFSNFLNQLHGDEKNYDSSSSWLSITLAKPHEVTDLRLDTRDWGDHTAEDFDQESDDDGEDDLPEEDVEPTILPHRQTSLPASTSISTLPGIPKPKLRPASDILSRLRWDPALDPGDYIVGYEDRFLGPKEMPLDRWKSEVSDEEFVPMHRILWFRKKGVDGEVVWDRKKRVDLVFGSGG